MGTGLAMESLKSAGILQAIQKEKTYNAALYCRLSNEDVERNQSASIDTQIAMLEMYANDNGYKIYDRYIDDGVSGKDFNRPSFQRMIADIKVGKVNMVIVKDLSRFGREHTEGGKIIEDFFPEMDVRFISLGESIDTLFDNNSFMIPLLNVINEHYLREQSKKTKAALRARAMQGKYMGTYAPYGYRKDPGNNNHLIVDETSAAVVKQIFEMARKSMGYRNIATFLRENEVLTPTEYNLKIGVRKNKCHNASPYPYNWTETTVHAILHNINYLGHTVNGKQHTLSHKNSKMINRDPSEWIIVENTHEPLITQEIWDICHSLMPKRKQENVGKIPQIFTGVLKCDTCGKHMVFNGLQKSYNCSLYLHRGKKACQSHSISYKELYSVVLTDIRYQARMVKLNESGLISQLLDSKNITVKNKRKAMQKELDKASARVLAIDSLITKLYEDRAFGKITEERYDVMLPKYEAEQAELKTKTALLQAELTQAENDEQSVTAFVEIIKRYKDIDSLDMEIVSQLIERIEVSSAYFKDDIKQRDIYIYYKFIGRIY